jgi:hypothetical protein
MTMWVLLAVLVVTFTVARLGRRRRGLVPVLPEEPISALGAAMSRSRTAEAKSALEAATKLLR